MKHCGPRAAIRKRLRIIPVEQRDKRADAVGEQRVNQAVVKRDAILVDRADALRQNARPGEGEAVVFYAQPRHELYVFFDAVIMIAGDIAGVTAVDFARPVGKRIPDGRPLAAIKCRAFNLVGRGRRAPNEILAKAHEKNLLNVYMLLLSYSKTIKKNRAVFEAALFEWKRKKVFSPSHRRAQRQRR